MQRKTTKNGPKSSNIWSKIDGNLITNVENVPKCNQKIVFFQTWIFQRKKRSKKDDSMAPGG